MTDPVYKRSAELLEAEVGDDLVALDAEAGTCFGFNPVASSVWHLLSEPKRFSEIRDQLLVEYDVDTKTCSDELQELLDDMASKGLVNRQST